MPLNNVNFPRNWLVFMKMLNEAVSFNLIDPTTLTFIPKEFTPTPPYFDNFGWLQYDSSNFFENIGFISLLVVFLMARQLIISPCMHHYT